ncbi:hypothetical protein JMUB7552_27470 [Staphylococcus aureus]
MSRGLGDVYKRQAVLVVHVWFLPMLTSWLEAVSYTHLTLPTTPYV